MQFLIPLKKVQYRLVLRHIKTSLLLMARFHGPVDNTGETESLPNNAVFNICTFVVTKHEKVNIIMTVSPCSFEGN